MAHGKPVIGTRAGGLPDKVRPGVNGWLADEPTPEALAHAISEALDARNQWPTFGASSRHIVSQEFAWDALVDRTIAVYEELLARRT
jgi:glycosyltransferase involved in cell wall biosynthesis